MTMVQPVDRQPAYVLHRRAYRESSALLELLTQDFGRIGGVVRGVKRSPRSAYDIEPFGRIAVSWRGRGQLVTLLRAETVMRHQLAGDALFAGLYINELLVKTLGREEPVAGLFHDYDAAVESLGQRGASGLEPILRIFERRLLDELGYGIAFDVDIANGRPIEPGRLYRVVDGEGFREVDAAPTVASALVFDGGQIAAMNDGEFRDPAVLRGAKQILRRAIALRLGGRPLTTRRLFAATRLSTAGEENTARMAN